MGYDKPDLGFVVHYQAPGSIVAYYQQVGRAGRAIDYAVGVLLAGREDEEIQNYFRASAFPDERHVNGILEALAESDGLSERQLEADVNLRKGQIDKVLKYLSVENPSPVIKDGSRWRRTPVAYRLDQQHIQRLTRQRAGEWQEVQEYIKNQDCLMLFLARSLDDEQAQPCGRCARCLGRPVISEEFPHHLAVAAALYLKHTPNFRWNAKNRWQAARLCSTDSAAICRLTSAPRPEGFFPAGVMPVGGALSLKTSTTAIFGTNWSQPWRR